MSIEIPLSKGGITLIDDEDFERVSSRKWTADNYGYAVGSMEGKTVKLHRIIMRASPGQIVDHINRDRLDNRKENLRFCTLSQNRINSAKGRNNKSGYRGVSYHKGDKRWEAQIMVDKFTIKLGRFKELVDAVEAYRIAAIKYHGIDHETRDVVSKENSPNTGKNT